MSTRDVTIWVCDRCDEEVEHRGAPPAWHGLEHKVLGSDEPPESMDLCGRCWQDVLWTLTNIIRTVDDPA